jgi:hypothetical protein
MLFQKPARIENIDSSILDFEFYYCILLRVERSLADFFDSIGQNLPIEALRCMSVMALTSEITADVHRRPRLARIRAGILDFENRAWGRW